MFAITQHAKTSPNKAPKPILDTPWNAVNPRCLNGLISMVFDRAKIETADPTIPPIAPNITAEIVLPCAHGET
jgi:hypothetical protein